MILSVLFLLIGIHSHAESDHKILTDWKLDRKSDDIEISYRKLMVGDTFKTREIRIAFEVDAPPEKIIPLFQDPEVFGYWSAGIEDCKLLAFDQSQWLLYSLYDLPWPFSARDVVTKYQVEEQGGIIKLRMSGQPDVYPVTKNVFRIREYEGYWQFSPYDDDSTRVEFHSIALYKPIAPRWIQDPIIQNAFIKSIARMKQQLLADN